MWLCLFGPELHHAFLQQDYPCFTSQNVAHVVFNKRAGVYLPLSLASQAVQQVLVFLTLLSLLALLGHPKQHSPRERP